MLGCFALDNIAKLVQHDDVMTDACRKGDCINAHDTTKHVQLCMTTTCWLASQQVIWEPASSLHSVTVSVTAVLAINAYMPQASGLLSHIAACSLRSI